MMLFARSLVVGSGALAGASPMVSGGESAVGAWTALIGVAGLITALLLIRRIGRSIDDAEGAPSSWRSQGNAKAGPSVPQPRDGRRDVHDETGRGLRGRRVARLTLSATIALDTVLVLLVTSGPSTMGGGGWFREPPRFGWLIPAFGVALHLVGLVWMMRIIRADPERHRSFWRSRRS